MYKVLIVEDEMLVRTGIRASIHWEKFNMYVVSEASNGQMAWDLYQKYHPDLILTDIKMPFMDGIELISKIRENDTSTQIIILSCLEDFYLAQKAIRLGISGYILKLTMTTEEMESVLANVQTTLNKFSQSCSSVQAPVKISEVLENNLLGYLSYNLPPLSKCLDNLKQYNLVIFPHDLVISLMEIDQYEHLQDVYKDSRGQLIQFSILNIMNEILQKNNTGFVIHESGARYLLLFHHDTEQRSYHLINNVLAEIQNVLNNYFNITPTFYISEISQNVTLLQQLYQQCLKLSDSIFFFSSGSINYYTDFWKDTAIQTLVLKTKQMLSTLSDASFSSRVIMDSLEKDLKKDFTAKTAFNIFYNGYSAVLHKYLTNEKDAFVKIRDFLHILSTCKTYYEMVNTFVTSVKVLEKLAKNQISCSREVLQALSFLQEHYHRQITLNEVSCLVGLSPNYFSSIFKKELGTSFLEYLNRYRIEKSMELLQNTTLKTYEIAFQCGFSDEGYYGKTFKKYTGKTPNEYKKSCSVTITP